MFQVQLDLLNQASGEINRLENELDVSLDTVSVLPKVLNFKINVSHLLNNTTGMKKIYFIGIKMGAHHVLSLEITVRP